MGKMNISMDEDIIEEEVIDEEDFNEDEEGIETVSLTHGKDLSDVAYEEFSKPQRISNEELVENNNEFEDSNDEDNEKKEEFDMEDSTFISILSIFWTWFRRLGIVIAILLSAYYAANSMFYDLFVYILMLVAAYFFGYGFMFVLTQLMENR